MPPIEVSIFAEGSLPPEEIVELADLGVHSRADQVVLDGTVTDQAALIGVLERLRRADLRIRDVWPAARPCGDKDAAHIVVTGRVGGLVRSVLDIGVVTEQPTMTTVVLALSSADDLFDAIERLGGLGLELRSVHVGRPAVLPPDDGDP
ncbi:hypothetical protein [Ornithinimicrobium sp. LYQ103]|uniref:hypothetical protein n=1 Tax=Ornithinimicrobium sp. LYQ103 TaxID=3378796 RepID=UPI00385399FE